MKIGNPKNQSGELLGPLNSSTLVYGIDYDTTIATAADACKRVVLFGNTIMSVDNFSSMPAHNLRRCVMSDLASRTVAYYLDPEDSSRKENGDTADLTGADGDVMVEIPITYWKVDHYTDESGHAHVRYLVSASPFTGSKPHPFFYVSPGGDSCRTQYVGAFRSVLCDSAGAVKVQTEDATPAVYASGDTFRSIAGYRPAANISRTNFRAGSVANGGTNVNSLFHQWLLLMMAIDGCTFDTQTGISVGYSNLSAYNYAAVRKTGRTAGFGNGTGEVLADDANSAGEDYDLLSMNSGLTMWNSTAQGDPSKKVVQFSWRGIEDPFGSMWCFEDGIQKYQNGTADDYSQSGYWITSNTSKYSELDSDKGAGEETGSFPESGYTGENLVWVHHAFPKSSGYVSQFNVKSLFPETLGGSSTSGLADSYYGESGGYPRAVARGGEMSKGKEVGAGFISVTVQISSGSAVIGVRISA